MSGILTPDELDHWYRWRDRPGEYGAYISAIDVRALVDHIQAVGEKYAVAADVAATYDCYALLPESASDQSRRAVATALDDAHTRWKAADD